MIGSIKTKQDVAKALASREIEFTSSFEVVNESDLRVAVDKIKGYLRQSKKLQLVIVERP
jgi:hypothetical protein